MVARSRQKQRRGGAKNVQINAAWFAVVGEAVAGLPAGVAVEGASGVGRRRQKIEGVLLVERVSDFSWHLVAVLVEIEVADCA